MLQKNTLINVFLMLAIVALAIGIVSSYYKEPQTYTFDPQIIQQGDEVSIIDETPYRSELVRYEQFGKNEIFKQIVPTPTKPTPRPPKPTITPSLSRTIARWELKGLPGNEAYIYDSSKKQDFSMKVGEEKSVKYGRVTVQVKLESTDTSNFSATFSYKDQKVVKKMF